MRNETSKQEKMQNSISGIITSSGLGKIKNAIVYHFVRTQMAFTALTSVAKIAWPEHET